MSKRKGTQKISNEINSLLSKPIPKEVRLLDNGEKFDVGGVIYSREEFEELLKELKYKQLGICQKEKHPEEKYL